MAVTEMYLTCFIKIRQLRPSERVTRVRNMDQRWTFRQLRKLQDKALRVLEKGCPVNDNSNGTLTGFGRKYAGRLLPKGIRTSIDEH